MEVAKEKTSRVMEILISSVNPITQLFGKVLGIGLVGTIQTLIFVLVGYIASEIGNKDAQLGGIQFNFANAPTSTILYAILFFILGLLLLHRFLLEFLLPKYIVEEY